jgi:uncharacterized lipoprotein
MKRRMKADRWKVIALISLVFVISACSSQKKWDEEYYLQQEGHRAARLQTPPGPGSWNLPGLP